MASGHQQLEVRDTVAIDVQGQQRLVGRWLLLVVQGLASVALLTLGILLFGAALNA
jgi:hypothetical protein